MRNDSFSLNFYPHPKKRTGTGEIPLYVRITVNRKKTELSTRESIKNLGDWDPIIQRVSKPNSIINKVLNSIEVRLKDVFNELHYAGRTVTSELIKTKYLGQNQNAITVAEYFENHFKEKIQNNAQFADGTVKNYRGTYNHLLAFLEAKNLKKTLLVDVNENFVRKLDQYLHNTLVSGGEEPLKLNTIIKYHTKFKTVLLTAIQEGLLEKNPYQKFSLKEEPGTRTFLTKPELTALENHDLGNNASLKRVRDIFMFSVYTGLRFNDAQRLTADNIEFDGKKFWILLQQQKTKSYLRIPMLDGAIEIYEKYLLERTVSGFVLPRISNPKINAYLKVIADLIGIKKILTHHVARHTTATTIFLANGVPIEVVSRQLGHTNIKTTQVYAKITNEMLGDAAEIINEKLKIVK